MKGGKKFMRNCENELVYALSEFKTISRKAAVTLLEKRSMIEAFVSLL